MRPLHHVLLSAASAGAVYALTRAPDLAAVNFAAGVLIDLDHVVDHVLHAGRIFDRRSFWDAPYHLAYKRMYVFFHSWELGALLALSGCFLPAGPLIFSAAAGMGLHLLGDTIINPGTWKSYFLIYRIKNAFRSEICFPNPKNRR